jgi:stearoyl-CoA desaturase (delta-9 desaturase)
MTLFSGLFDLGGWQLVAVALVFTHITIAGVTIFLHRHQAHRALEMHPLPSHFFRFWLWMTTGMVTREWAAIHRKHHAKCETADDPHSPQIHGINKVLWGGVVLYVKESRNRDTIERYGHGTPDDWLERNVYARHERLGVTLMLLINLLLFGVVPGFLVWLVQIMWIPFWAAGVINGWGHWFGYRSFRTADASVNILPWGILIGGEELHNNHHAFGTSARLSNKWYEFDIGWLYIRILETLGLAKVKHVAPVVRLGPAKPTCDMGTLQAVIANRYEVMARYDKLLMRAWREASAGLPESAAVADARAAETLLTAQADTLSTEQRGALDRMIECNPTLATLHTMRGQLTDLWQRSLLGSEALLQSLQDWNARAAASGIAPLEEFAVRLRRYA